MGTSKFKTAIFGLAALFCAFAFAGCGAQGGSVDPGAWGYECLVTYDSLGGMVNAREVRKTYYLTNSYVFKPSGSSNMLVDPVKDGYILAGWYTAKSDTSANSVEEYGFSAADRWDFSVDRVQSDITLFARWLPRGKVNYVDAESGKVLFSKNITTDSPIQELSSSVLQMQIPAGKSFAGYYDDAACTVPYNFSAYVHVDPAPTEAALYAKLFEMFPSYFARIEYTAPEEVDTTFDTSWLFLNKLGYELTEAGLAALPEIRAAKDQIVEEAIETYLTNTANRMVYMKFTEGNYVRAQSANDLKLGGKFGFFDTDAKGQEISGYIIEKDIDLSGVSFSISDKFTGTVNGNGHSLMNLQVAVSSKKVDTDTKKIAGLAALMENATFNDLTFENAKLNIQINSGIKVTAGLLAAEGKNVTFNNCHFKGLTLVGGKGDDGKAQYRLGDLFGVASGVTFNGCTAEGLEAEVFAPEKLNLSIFELPAASGEAAANP